MKQATMLFWALILLCGCSSGLPSASSSADSVVSRSGASTQLGEAVYITEHGESYHMDGCWYLKKSSVALSLEDARLSHSPCTLCNPPT